MCSTTIIHWWSLSCRLYCFLIWWNDSGMPFFHWPCVLRWWSSVAALYRVFGSIVLFICGLVWVCFCMGVVVVLVVVVCLCGR